MSEYTEKMNMNLVKPEGEAQEVDEVESDAYDELFLTEPLLMRDGQWTLATVKLSEAIYNQIDDDGVEKLLFADIIGHTKDSTAITHQEAMAIREEEQNNAEI
jgi:hypothetical protein